jgi:hypothetical protein
VASTAYAPVLPGADNRTQAVGVGYTPEGLDTNPAYYELLQEAAFKTSHEPNLTEWLIKRAHRRYGLIAHNSAVAVVWANLRASAYTSNGEGFRDTHDNTGVCCNAGSSCSVARLAGGPAFMGKAPSPLPLAGHYRSARCKSLRSCQVVLT